MVSHLLILFVRSQTPLETGAKRAEALYRSLGGLSPAGSSEGYSVGDPTFLASPIESPDRWKAAVRGDGSLLSFSADFGARKLDKEAQGDALTAEERHAACLAAYRAAGGRCDLWFQESSPSYAGPNGRVAVWTEFALPVWRGVAFLDLMGNFDVGSVTGRVFSFSLGDARLEGETFPVPDGFEPTVSVESARANLAALVFALGKEPAPHRYFFPWAHALEEFAEPKLAAWIPRPVTSGGMSERRFQSLSPSDLALGRRGEARLVWWVRLRTSDGLEESSVEGEYGAKIDAHTGKVLEMGAGDSNDGLGRNRPSVKSRPAPALSGPATLTIGNKTKAVRLVPVAATRPFSPSGRAVLGVGKRLFDAEYDAKAGLVRYKGKLARTLLTAP